MDNTFRDGDPRTIELGCEAERAYWCKAFGVTETQLFALVDAVGPSAQRVKDALVVVAQNDGGRTASVF